MHFEELTQKRADQEGEDSFFLDQALNIARKRGGEEL
jgi:hypothetical protein